MKPDEIIRKLAEMRPYFPGEHSGELNCFFCSAMEAEPHEKDCIWLAAQAIKAVVGSAN